MTTDQAFDNLMNKKALSIPLARRSGEASAGAGDLADRARPATDIAMKVDLDEAPGDYHPMGGEAHDSVRGVYSHPTETDLDAMDGEPDAVASAHLHGARIVGRDTAVAERVMPAGDTDADIDDDGFTEAREIEPDAGEYGLGRARRVPRFAYLPLSGMDAFESEARDMMASLTSANPDHPSLAVTSPSRGDGRTELSIRLALALAKRVGHRVLLIDFDVRKPSIASRLGLATKYFTLTDVLRGSCRLGEALVASDEDNLYVLPARAIDREGDEVLDGRQVEMLLEQVHGAFDFAVLDCGPAGQADAMITCRQAGSVALAGRSRRTSAPLMRLAGENLAAAGARIAGMVVVG